jgi:predicted transcriptional regulator
VDKGRHEARGGKGGCEPRARIIDRQLRAWELAIVGRSQRAIALELGVSQSAVSKILRRVGRQRSHELEQLAAQQLGLDVDRLDYVFREAADAWEKSKTESSRRRQQRTQRDGPAAAGAGASTTIAEAIVSTREGDPRFLSQARAAVADRRALLKPVQGGTRKEGPDEPPADPYQAIAKLTKLGVDELKTLEQIRKKTLGFTDPARELFDGLTPNELRALADIQERLQQMADDDDDRP